jgi:hypothetical protein
MQIEEMYLCVRWLLTTYLQGPAKTQTERAAERQRGVRLSIIEARDQAHTGDTHAFYSHLDANVRGLLFA